VYIKPSSLFLFLISQLSFSSSSLARAALSLYQFCSFAEPCKPHSGPIPQPERFPPFLLLLSIILFNDVMSNDDVK
jgi:hypothetical protein